MIRARHKAGRRRGRFAILLLVSAALSGLPGFRARAETFLTVDDVPVDVTAKSAAAARDIAITDAQRAAFAKLIKRLVPNPADQARIKPTQADIDSFVQDFAVESERTSPVRYIGLYSVRFRAGRVRKFLSDSGVSAINAPTQALIVPIYKTPAAALLWGQGNNWRTAWERGGFGDGPVTLILPNGDAFDAGALPAAAALGGDMAPLGALMQRYHAAGIVIATAEARDPARGPASGLAITVTTYDSAGPKGAQTLTIDPIAGEPPDGALLRGVKAVADALETGWGQAIGATGSTGLAAGSAIADPNASETGGAPIDGETVYPIAMQIDGLDDWVRARDQLVAMPGAARVSLDALTRTGAALTLDFAGDPLALQAALADAGYVLVQTAPGDASGPGGFELRRSGTPPSASPPPSPSASPPQ